MLVTLEITLYPLGTKPEIVISNFVDEIAKYSELNIETNQISTLISGEYDEVFRFLNTECKSLFEKYPASFVIKLSNSCGCQV